MKIKAVNILITRNPMTIIPKTVKPWEVPVFRSQYGDEAISIVGDAVPVEVDDLPDPQEEYTRLRMIFGIDTDTKQSHADIVYGRGQNGVDLLAKAIKASAVSGDVESAQKVVDGSRKLTAEEKEVRADAHRDPLAEEFADQSNQSVLGAASGGPGDVSAAGAADGKKK